MFGIRFSFLDLSIFVVCLLLVACKPNVSNDPITPIEPTSATQNTPIKSASPTQIETTPFEGKYIINTDVATLRSGPSVDFVSRGTMEKGEVIQVIGISSDGTWFKLDDEIWISTTFVKLFEEEISPSTVLETGKVVTSTIPSKTTPINVTEIHSMDSLCINPPPGWVNYFVKPGDNLFQLSIQTDSTVSEIQSVNCLQDDNIYPDQKLFLPRLPVIATLLSPLTPTRPSTPISGPKPVITVTIRIIPTRTRLNIMPDPIRLTSTFRPIEASVVPNSTPTLWITNTPVPMPTVTPIPIPTITLEPTIAPVPTITPVPMVTETTSP